MCKFADFKFYFMRTIRIISRFVLGIVFVFSGFLKGVDPLGTAYKIEDYFIAFGTDWAMSLALPLAVLLCATEFSLGVFLLFNIFKNFTAWITLLMMGFFTLLTLNDAIYNPVPDCGCFGDFIILTNRETFYKNIVIDVFLIVVFITRNRFENVYSRITELSIAILTISIFTLFNSYNIHHLPVINFRDWKVGTKLTVDNPQPLEYYLIYKNKSTGETQEFLSPNYPFNDSVWMSQWEYADMRVVDPNNRPTDVRFFDMQGKDVTDPILGDPNYHFLLVSYDVDLGNWKNIEDIQKLKSLAENDGFSFSLITASPEENVDSFKAKNQLDVEVYQSDDIDLKTIIRSNPGLIVLKDGVILGQWAHSYLPEYEDVVKK